MNLDCYFAVGKQHAVCQDYALARNGRVVLADGCSSSPHTDLGARLLCLSSTELLSRGTEAVVVRAHDMQRQLGLPEACLDATLGMLTPQDSKVDVVLYGDGVFVLRARNGDIWHEVIECLDGAPDYLSYTVDPTRWAGYQAKFSQGKEVSVFLNGELVEKRTFASGSAFVASAHATMHDLALLLTDGAHTFFRPGAHGPERVPTFEVVQQVTDIRGYKGDFVTRRLKNGFLGRFCREHGWWHNDDFTAAGVYLGDAP